MPSAEERSRRRELAYHRGRARLEASYERSTSRVPRLLVEYARCVLRDDGAEGSARATALLERALEGQELEAGHPHHGGFKRNIADEEVTGLNVTSFVLQQLVALWAAHRDRLAKPLRSTILDRVRLALGHLERVDVALRYTNPAVMDLANTILWGEILEDADVVAAGRARLDAWIAFTAASGAPYEYNSPSYIVVDLSALATLTEASRDPAVRLKAQLMEERLWLHALLHYHAATGQLAGPHCRAYHPLMHGGADGIVGLLWQELGIGPAEDERPSPYGFGGLPGAAGTALTRFHCPAHLATFADGQIARYPYTVRETAAREGIPAGSGATDIATHCTAEYALGTASRTYTIGQGGFDIEHQANYCILYYRAADGWRTLYTRFVVNDAYLGGLVQPPNRRATTNFYDQGLFAGHQDRNVAIALYGIELFDREVTSVEALAVLPGPVRPRAIYAAGQRIDLGAIDAGQPAPVPDGEWVIVEDDRVWIGIRPLARDHMGHRRGVEVRRLPTGEIVVAMPHYRGQPRWFWEYGSTEAAFYKRNLRSGMIVFAGARGDYPSYESVASHLAQAKVVDTLDEAGVRTVAYRHDDAWLEIHYDLVRNRTVERRIGDSEFHAPALASPWAVQVQGEPVTLGEATLDPGGAPAVLFARDASTAPELAGNWVWEATVLADGPHSVRLTTPAGTVRCAAFGTGAIRVEAAPGVSRPETVHVRCTGTTEPVVVAAPGAGTAAYTITVEGAEWTVER